jgi:3-oxoacyl-[acyl-carrier-protein] synthase II
MPGRRDEERVVVTGVGLVSPIGIGREEAWASAVAGRSGAGPITRFDAANLDVRMACEVRDFVPEEFMDRKAARRMDRFSHLAVAAARLALDDARLSVEGDGAGIGAVIASGTGGNDMREEQHRVMLERGPDRVSPFTIPSTIMNMAAAQVSMQLGLRGPMTCVTTACAAGTQAIGDAAEAIRRGHAEVMLAGGGEAMLTAFWVAAFDAMKVLSHRNDDPAGAARPFDRTRDGFLMGEVGAVLVLERLDQARDRGAPVVCEVAGFGSSADAHHITDPDPEGRPQVAASRAALADAGLPPEAVEYVNAHGGASKPGDPTEAHIIRTALGEEVAARTAVSATKSMHGHCMGATGALEAALTAMAIEHGRIPPTINLDDVDPSCAGLDHVANVARDADLRTALSLSYGLGGHNAALVLTRVED